MGVVLSDGRWWVFFEDEWLGYFDATDWDARLDRAESLQWFGEVFTPHLPPRVPMGNGGAASQSTAARFDQVCDVPRPGERCIVRDRRFAWATDGRWYGVVAESGASFRYGGPGEAAGKVTPPPPPSAANAGTPPATETSVPSPPR
jgi:Neprosin